MSRSWTPARLALLLALLALAEWLRATGLSFGLPAVYNPDEVAIMSRALGFARGDLNPHNFLYPTFYFYVLFAWVGGWFAFSWLTGAVTSLGAFQTQFFLDPSGVYHAGRMLGVACGVATVWLTWILGARMAGWRAGARVLAEATRSRGNSLNAILEGPAGPQRTLFQELPPGG